MKKNALNFLEFCKFVKILISNMMQKSIFTFLLIILFTNIFAQNIFFGGARLGLSGSQVSGDYLAGFNKAGVYLGVLAGLNVATDMNLHIEMQFVQKGSRKNARPHIGDFKKYLLRLNYFEIPLVLTYQGNRYFELEGGVAWGYLLRNTDVEFDENGVMPGKNPFRKNEISGFVGMNYLLNDNIKVNFRFNNSLTHIREHAGGGTYFLNTGQFNSVLLLGLVYKFTN